MSDFAATWELVRGRLEKEVEGLSSESLNYRLHPETLTIGEMAIHVSGTELWFISQLEGVELGGEEAKIARAAKDGVVNTEPFPFEAGEIDAESVKSAMAKGREAVDRHIHSPTDAILSKEIVSVLGPVIDGRGAFARLAYHPGYHQGQVHIIKTSPGFPKS